MASLRAQLTTLFAEAFAQHGFDPKFGEVVVSQRPDLGQFQCNGALPAAGNQKPRGNPRQIAQKIVDTLQDNPLLSALSLAGPGFINISLTDEALATHTEQMRQDDRFLADTVTTPRKVVVDYGGPNVAKPLHVGHLRASIIGESIKRIFKFQGDEVLGDIHLGDWGTQMGQLIAQLANEQPNLPYFDANYEGEYPTDSPVTIEDLQELYPRASGRYKEDETFAEVARQATAELQNGRRGYRALWQHFVNVSVSELKSDLNQLGVSFELWLGESDAHPRIAPIIQQLEESGVAYISDGALIMDIEKPDDKKEVPPVMLRKRDGAVLYATTDLATIQERVEELKAELILYVVDARQQDHFIQVFRAAQKSGIAPEAQVGLEHNYFGTMNGTDGKPFKTRAGGVMRLKDLMEMVIGQALKKMEEAPFANEYEAGEAREIARKVGLSALKFGDLSNQRTKDYVFDLERFSSFEGKTGPYLLYTAVRAKSILRKAKDQGLTAGTILPPIADTARLLMLQLEQLPDMVAHAYDQRMPHSLAEYAYQIATAYNRFYGECHILTEEDTARQASWLALSELSIAVLEQLLYLLGIEVPERM